MMSVPCFYETFEVSFFFQIQDLIFSQNGQEFFSAGDAVTRESADRNIMAWDWRSSVVLSNQIFQVSMH
jgi:hypothetical protein